MTYDCRRFYINGCWVQPDSAREQPIVSPATELPIGMLALGGALDVDRAVNAARDASEPFGQTTPSERQSLLRRVLTAYRARHEEVALAISAEMGAPITLARKAQAATGVAHLETMIAVLDDFDFNLLQAGHRITYDPIGVCALITPWNWPINQIAAKVVPALAAGCTMVLKPSEFSPCSAFLWTQVLDDAGVPPGVFNLVHGEGSEVGTALAMHPAVDMVSFTGSTRAGVSVAACAAPTVKRVHQELGGKSPCVLAKDADFDAAVANCVRHVMTNSGQSCNAPTRLIVPADRLEMVEGLANKAAVALVVGDPASPATHIGPVVSRAQFDRVQQYIHRGMADGAKLVCGGPDRPPGLDRGFFVRPTVFSAVRNTMSVARDEIFGPVLCILPYQNEEEAIEIANDTPYGLAAYVWSSDVSHASALAARIRAGQVFINGARGDSRAPFGGFKQSGNGREGGEHGLREFLEVKAIFGGT